MVSVKFIFVVLFIAVVSQTSALNSYTAADVAQRNGKASSDVWIIINNSVYDVTKFLDQHPGGRDAILPYAGKDATQAFEGKGHSSNAVQIRESYKIGVLA